MFLRRDVIPRHEGVYIASTPKEDILCTLNLVPGKDVYGEKRISVDVPVCLCPVSDSLGRSR